MRLGDRGLRLLLARARLLTSRLRRTRPARSVVSIDWALVRSFAEITSVRSPGL